MAGNGNTNSENLSNKSKEVKKEKLSAVQRVPKTIKAKTKEIKENNPVNLKPNQHCKNSQNDSPLKVNASLIAKSKHHSLANEHLINRHAVLLSKSKYVDLHIRANYNLTLERKNKFGNLSFSILESIPEVPQTVEHKEKHVNLKLIKELPHHPLVKQELKHCSLTEDVSSGVRSMEVATVNLTKLVESMIKSERLQTTSSSLSDTDRPLYTTPVAIIGTRKESYVSKTKSKERLLKITDITAESRTLTLNEESIDLLTNENEESIDLPTNENDESTVTLRDSTVPHSITEKHGFTRLINRRSTTDALQAVLFARVPEIIVTGENPMDDVLLTSPQRDHLIQQDSLGTTKLVPTTLKTCGLPKSQPIGQDVLQTPGSQRITPKNNASVKNPSSKKVQVSVGTRPVEKIQEPTQKNVKKVGVGCKNNSK